MFISQLFLNVYILSIYLSAIKQNVSAAAVAPNHKEIRIIRENVKLLLNVSKTSGKKSQ